MTISLKLGRWVGTQRGNKFKNLLSQNQIDRFESLPGWSWDALTDQWEEGFEQLKSYIKQSGNANVSQRYITHDFNLGSWVSTQRSNKLKNLLNQDRIERLEALPGWYWNVLAGQKEANFEHLQAYVKLYGNSRVPQKYVTSDGFKLGFWISHQRNDKAKNILSQDQIERFEALPGWSWDAYTGQWEEGFEQLQSYVTEHGNARVPNSYLSLDGFKLGFWVGRQRKYKTENNLSQDQIKRLEAVPSWSWSIFTDKLEANFEQLQSYVKQHGNARVPASHVSLDGFKLGSWVSVQRKNKLNNLLNQKQIERFEALPGWSWNILINQWEEGFEQLQSYVKEHGSARVPESYVSLGGLNLGLWVGTQRRNKAKKSLSQDRIERLEVLPGWVW